MTLSNSFPDRLLIEARDDSLQLEQIAADELMRNLGDYLEPNWRARRMAQAYDRYVKSGGENDEDEYLNLRAVYTETRGKSHKVFSDVLATHLRKAKYDLRETMFKGYLGQAGASKEGLVTMVNGEDGEDTTADQAARVVQGAARHLERYGWWKSRELAPETLVKSLRAKCLKTLVKANGEAAVDAAFEGRDGAAMQLKVGSKDAMNYEEMYELASDPLLLSIVQAYMGVPPIFNTPVAFLNSFVKPTNDRALSDVAQLYHHDMHRLGFVKVFIYLTDVDADSGPHTLIQGTHRSRPDPLWADGRHTDATVKAAGLGGSEVNITGKAGTVFLVDTSCLHKGAHPNTTSRLMAQVQYVNSLFGKPIAKSDHRVEMAQTSRQPDVLQTADIVRKYAIKTGVRFMQNFI